MADHYILCNSTTGERLNDSADIDTFARIKPTEEIITVDRADMRGIWNPATKSFDARPREDYISRSKIILRVFTRAEYRLLALSTDDDAVVFMARLQALDGLDFATQGVIDDVNALVPAVLTAERAVVILNG